MLVQCPKCKTTYKVADEVVKGAAAAFRCSRCKHTFELETEDTEEIAATVPPSTEETTPIADENPELNFDFAAKTETGVAQAKEEQFSDASLRDGLLADEKDAEPSEDWSISTGATSQDEPFTLAAHEATPADQKIIDAPADGEPQASSFQSSRPQWDATASVLPIETYRDQQASVIPYFSLFGLLVIFFSIMTAFIEVHPATSEAFVKKIPLVGTTVLKNTHLKSGVLLQSLVASYQSILGNKEVFVITGIAANQNPIVIREVKIQGQIFNDDGKELEQQTVWIGNAISPKIVRGMTAQDILDLQRLKPLKTFEIPPGDSAPFTIVFFKSLKQSVKNFTCDIVSAEGDI
jgi:predicted Zn finger-like uncharacterized protein